MSKDTKKTGLALMREPFPESAIGKLPKPTKRQTDDVRSDYKNGIRCQICGQWHHPQVVHLDYVGHAALTDRLLECDENWNWEPVGFSDNGGPVFDSTGGMWIKLTVCNVTRLGYGNPDGKTGGNAVKEVIGDALRNAAMRFGAALDLWHKGELHVSDGEPPKDTKQKWPTADEIKAAISTIEMAENVDELKNIYGNLFRNFKDIAQNMRVVAAKDQRKIALANNDSIEDDTNFLKGE